MQSVSPVFSDEEVRYEKVIALDQPQYAPIILLPITVEKVNESDLPILVDGHEIPPGNHYLLPNMAACVRFRLTDEDRANIARGCDLVVTELVFGKPFTPINFQIVMPGERPEL